MHTIIIAKELFPFVGTSRLARETAAFAKGLKHQGHDITCVTPFIQDLDIHAHSLARRLMPLKGEINGAPFSATRYDGRTPGGIDVYLLDVTAAGNTPPGDGDDVLFFAAAFALVASLAKRPDALILFGTEASLAAVGSTDALDRLESTARIAVLDSEFADGDQLADILGSVNRLVVTDRSVKERMLAALEKIGLPDSSPVDILVIPLPPSARPKTFDKPSEKVATQVRLGLPVRADVPLVVLFDWSPAILSELLRRDVQSVVAEGPGITDELRESYPDRLAIVPPEDIDRHLAGADACTVASDRDLANRALASGAVPIVGADLKLSVVDLEPGMETGSGIVSAGGDLTEGLARLVALFEKSLPFSTLLRRLPGYTTTWEEVASRHIALIEEIATEINDHGQQEQ